MTAGIMTSLQRCSFPPCLQISSPPPSSLCSTSQYVSLRAQCVSSPWVRWVGRSRCEVQRFPVRFVVASGSGALGLEVEEEDDDEEDDDEEDGLSLYEEELGLENEEGVVAGVNAQEQILAANGVKARRSFRLLGSKEKKELRAYAHQLGNDICIHQVGKWGLTANCVTAISDALEANELVKIRVLDNLDEELVDTAGQLESKTGAQIVGKMGRTFLLYRPSMRKLKAAQAAEEKAYKYQKRKSMLASRSKSSRSFPGPSRGKR